MLAQRRGRWPSITSALRQCIMLSMKCFWRRDRKRHPHYNAAVRKHGTSTQMLFQCRASVEDCGSTLKQHEVDATCFLICWRKINSRPSVGLVLGKRRRRFTGIEPAMGCDAQHWTGIWWVGLHPLYEVHRRNTRQVLSECWPVQAMVWWWCKEYALKIYFNLTPWFFP